MVQTYCDYTIINDRMDNKKYINNIHSLNDNGFIELFPAL